MTVIFVYPILKFQMENINFAHCYATVIMLQFLKYSCYSLIINIESKSTTTNGWRKERRRIKI